MSLSTTIDIARRPPLSSMEVGRFDESLAKDTRSSRRNWINVGLFGLNFFVSFSSLSGIYGMNNAEISEKYQTLLTPTSWIFSIWGMIFLCEGVAMLAQFLPEYRDSRLVVASSPWWVASCVFQILWTFAFTREAIALSVVMMLGILASLVGMTLRVDAMALTPNEHALLRAPFALHMSWIIVASVVNVNVLADSLRSSPATLLAVAIVSLSVITGFATVFILVVRRPEPLVPFIACLSFAAIASELTEARHLRNPYRFNPHDWPEEVIWGLRQSLVSLNAIAGTAWLVTLAVKVRVASLASA